MLVYQQREFLLYALNSFLCGILLGGIYGSLRILGILFGITASEGKGITRLYSRRLPLIGRLKSGGGIFGRKLAAVEFFKDVGFFVIAAFAVLAVAFFGNDGKIRAQCLAITAAGMLLYHFSLGRLLEAASAYIAYAIRILHAYLLWLAAFPIMLITKAIKRPLTAILRYFERRIRAAALVKEAKKYTYYVECLSRHAFLYDVPCKDRKEKR